MLFYLARRFESNLSGAMARVHLAIPKPLSNSNVVVVNLED